jgi:hypothetical protein
MTIKICTGCGEPKDAENDFSWSIRGIKRHSKCKVCHSKEHSEYYARNKDKVMEYKWDRQVRKREEARAYVTEYLRTHPCVDCGESDPLVLTFDHVRGKKRMNIAEVVNRGYLLEAIKEEIEKCEVRCANCHMRIEKQRRGTKYW